MNFGMYGVMVELGKLRIVDCGGCQTSQDGCQLRLVIPTGNQQKCKRKWLYQQNV
jgi:hypothetical protein